MACIVCGIRPAVDGTVCTECSTVLEAAATGSMAPAPEALPHSQSPTSPVHTAGSSGDAHPHPVELARRYVVGDVLEGRYTIVEEIGRGGMGVVYKALDRTLEKPVALKLMRPKVADAVSIARFRRELALAQRVSHPNVCRVHDLGEVEGVLFISMEHVEGQRLDHLIVSMNLLSVRQTVLLGRQLCAGLRAIHEQGIIHRDLKPSNVMVNRSGHVFIMDFGLAIRPGNDKVTSTGAVLGTFAYLSPEQARGLEVGPRSDIYAAGLILYEMLTGVTPPGDEMALPLALREAKERCPPPSHFAPEVPAELDAIVMRCLERDPGRRFGSAAELEAALDVLHSESAALSSRAVARRSSIRAGLSQADPRRRWIAGGTLALAVMLAAAAARVWVWPSAPSDRSPVVAVLPFHNLSQDPALASLGVGLSDVLVTRLAAAPRITIVSAAAGAKDARAIAKELGVSHIVSGTVQASGDRVRVALTLLRARDSVVTSVGEDEAPLSDIFGLQARLAERVTSALDVELSEADRHQLTRPVTASLEAFSQYSQAKALLQPTADTATVKQAIQQLEEARRLDPRFALAHAALGEAYLAQFRETKDPAWATPAMAAIVEALSLDPNQPAVRLSLALAFKAMGRRDQALAELRNVLARQPDNDAAYVAMARVLSEGRQFDDAVAAIDRAIALRPGYWEHHFTRGDILREARRYDAAVASAQEAIRLHPEGGRGHELLGNIYAQQDKRELALASYERALALEPSAPVAANIGSVTLWTGDYAAAARAYRQAIALQPTEPLYYMNLASAEERLHSGNPPQNYARALELLNGLLALKPDHPRYRGFPAICEMKLGHPDRAQASIEAAMRLTPDDPVLMYRASVVYAASARTDRALSLLEQALAAGLPVWRVERGDGLESLKGRPELKALLEKARGKESNVNRSAN